MNNSNIATMRDTPICLSMGRPLLKPHGILKTFSIVPKSRKADISNPALPIHPTVVALSINFIIKPFISSVEYGRNFIIRALTSLSLRKRLILVTLSSYILEAKRERDAIKGTNATISE